MANMRGKKPFLSLTLPPSPNVQENAWLTRETHDDRQRASGLLCVLFWVSPIYHLLVSHWANTSWQEASLGERKQAPLRLLCVCVCVSWLQRANTDRKKPCGWPVNRQKMCPRLNLFTPKSPQFSFSASSRNPKGSFGLAAQAAFFSFNPEMNLVWPYGS